MSIDSLTIADISLIGIGMDNQLWTRKTLTSNWEHIVNSGAVIGITVLADGTIVGIGMDHQLWTRKTLTSNWELIPNSGAVIGITVLADGTIVGIGMDHQLWTRKTLTSNWELIPNSGAVIGITVLADGTIVGIGMDNQLWTRKTLTSPWQLIPNSGAVIGITVTGDGTLVGIGMDHQLWTRKTLTSTWELIPNSAAVLGLTAYAKVNALQSGSVIKFRSWKGDYLHRPDTAQGVTTWNTGIGNEWNLEVIGDNKIKLRSWKGDYLHRPDSAQDVTTWNTGVGNEWNVELIGYNKLKLKSWKGDYLHRPDTAQGVTTWNTGIGNEWNLEIVSAVQPVPRPLQFPIVGGNNVIEREAVDKRTNFYFADTNYPINAGGVLNSWEIWAKNTTPVQLVIYRRSAGVWSVVGKSELQTPALGLNHFSLSTPLSVAVGDYVGAYFPEAGCIAYHDYDQEQWDVYQQINCVALTTTGAEATAFGGLANRIYSIKVNGVADVASHLSNGQIILNADEWTFSDQGFQAAPDTVAFAQNVAKYFVGEKKAKFHALSNNFGLTGGMLERVMKDAGHTWTKGFNIPVTLDSFKQYDALFVGGDYVDNRVLIDYVQAGGKVYLCGGTGQGGSQTEANNWNTFLYTFGLKLDGVYNNIGGTLPVNNDINPLFAGVRSLYQNNGNSIIDLQPNSPVNHVIVKHTDGQGLIATAEYVAHLVVPVSKPAYGQVVVNADEWTLSDAGFQSSIDTTVFVLNLAKYFVGTNKGKFHVLSNNFGLNNGLLERTMKNAGHTWTRGLNITITAENLAQYDAVFVGGDYIDNQVLIEYVKGGGKVYLCCGTGQGGSQTEANNWNAFLWAFGLKVANVYNGISGNIPTNSIHRLFDGVRTLFQNDGNTVTELAPSATLHKIVMTHSDGQGLIATAKYLADEIPVISKPAYGQLVVNADEWTFSDKGFQATPDTTVFALNLAQYFVGSNKGKFHALSNNFGLTNGLLERAIKSAGHTWTKGLNIPVTLDSFKQYDALFIGGDYIDNQVLISYIKQGGKVYLCGGTGQGGSQVEANNWNALLIEFGLKLESVYNGIEGTLPVDSSTHVLFTGVKSLYQNDGNSIADLQPDNAANSIILSSASKQGLIAVADYDNALAPAPVAKPAQGRLVVNNDEWTLTNQGFQSTSDAAVFALNLAKYFVGSNKGKFHVLSNNFGLTSSSLAQIMKNAGHTWTQGLNITVDVPTLAQYDAIFIGEDYLDNKVLIEYIKQGGKVYLCGGTGRGGSQTEANAWNALLWTFGLKFEGASYNGIAGNLPVTQTEHPLFTGVKVLYQNDGNTLVDLQPDNAANSIIMTHTKGQGLLATADYVPSVPVEKAYNGQVVVNADEWTLSNEGFQSAPDTTLFVLNLAKYFVGDNASKFHIASNNFGLTGSTLERLLKYAGHSVTKGLNIDITLDNFLQYDAVFVGGDYIDNRVLIDYVQAGGKVYLCGGTGQGGSQEEANHWNTFLSTFGLKIDGVYNGIGGNLPVDSAAHALLAGVGVLYQNNGNSIVDLQPESDLNQLIMKHTNGQGLLAVAEFVRKPFVAPLPPLVIESEEFTITAQADVYISNLVYKGQVKQSQADEYVEISNRGNADADISGWKVTSVGSPKQFMTFPAGISLRAGQSIRIYTNEVHPETGGFSFHSKTAIWNDNGDELNLFDATAQCLATLAYGVARKK
ncbi:MAG: lamin tail domain-containing protein [Methylococcaceae bacterium]